jgi:ribosome-binding factor A
MGDPRLQGVTITGVKVTPDLRLTRVMVTKLGTSEERGDALKGLRGAAGFLRRELGARVSLRYVPELTFFLDDTWDRGARIDALLEQAHDGQADNSEYEE